ncbi:MAG: Flp pilus assembly complex ATPase component TadA [Anaerolineae bacterium]|nr:Flp pilus assembly complex ATPase component TadA [Anaerolineae bacterium]
MTDMNNTPPSNGHGENDDENEAAPQFLHGNRLFSHDALREKIDAQFYAENEGISPLYTADEPTQREALRDVVDYVLATEAISLTRQERARLQDELFRDLLGGGPLTELVADQSVNEIEIRSPYELFVRRYGEDAKPSTASFRDTLHLERSLRRWLAPTGFDLTHEQFIETGITLGGRAVRLTVITSSKTLVQSASLRLHPTRARNLDDLIADQMMDEAAVSLMRAILTRGYGLMLAGEANSGKTTLLQALLSELQGAKTAVVERASELRLSDEMQRLVVTPEHTFPTQINAAVNSGRDMIVLDEMRFDESAAMWDALTADHHPRCLWIVRGSSEPIRLRTAFSMAVRRTRQGIEQLFINSALLDRLPFVAFLGRRENRYKVLRIGEWVSVPGDPSSLELHQLWPAENGTTSSRLT